MDEEYNALIHNHTWSLVKLSDGRKLIGCKWLYKLKYKPYGTILRHKARLVAQGFSQEAGCR
ncbi:Retrovirus-related Pol polyprotein from transposon TNT 1-94 [Senna tora]|uniref:Retrovirus-related Pol polyprotein from transposon TNT 1-94 n=1 Tax=Senna tora TaxID=362788 RepID=A0A834TQU3_9FABA|nr:Retrovirus-related Pol polyprotein from transposon TNT 1-94 [Senna tora]